MEVIRRQVLPIALLACGLCGCGQKGPLYLPEKTGVVVTRPAAVPPETTTAPNSPQTVDSPATGDTPAPEVTAPDEEDQKKKDADENGAAKPR